MDISSEVIKILCEKSILQIDGNSVSFSENFLEYEEECITCWALTKTAYLDSIKNRVKRGILLCKMLEKDGIKVN